MYIQPCVCVCVFMQACTCTSAFLKAYVCLCLCVGHCHVCLCMRVYYYLFFRGHVLSSMSILICYLGLGMLTSAQLFTSVLVWCGVALRGAQCQLAASCTGSRKQPEPEGAELEEVPAYPPLPAHVPTSHPPSLRPSYLSSRRPALLSSLVSPSQHGNSWSPPLPRPASTHPDTHTHKQAYTHMCAPP